MFADRLVLRALIIGVITYLIVTNVVFGLVVHYWLPPSITDPRELHRLAEADPALLSWQANLGAFTALLAGFGVTHCSGAKSLRNALLFGLLLVLYGALGIYLHPSHSLWAQISKIISPVPVCLVGGWTRLLFGRQARQARGPRLGRP